MHLNDAWKSPDAILKCLLHKHCPSEGASSSMSTKQTSASALRACDVQPGWVWGTPRWWPSRHRVREPGQRAAVLWLLVAGTLCAASLYVYAQCSAPARPHRLPSDPHAPVVYVALGDSTVYGVGATSPGRTYVHRLYERLRAVYPQAQLANLGVSGATAAVVAGQLAVAVQQEPTLVTLSIGPNDITTHRELADFARDIDTIMSTLRAKTSAVLVVNLIPDLAVTPRFRSGPHAAQVGRRAEEFNAALSRSALAQGAVVVDLFTHSRAELPWHPEFVAEGRVPPF
jgi:lysophospholipase L1-like esterase